MTESTYNPVAAEAPKTTSGLSEEKQKELKGKIRYWAKWQVTIAVLTGILAVAAVIYSSVYSTDGCIDWSTFSSGCSYRHYPSFGVGTWSSIMTTLAGGLAICGTSSNVMQRERIVTHVLFAFIAIACEFISSVIAGAISASFQISLKSDWAYYALIIVITITGFIKILLLGMSVQHSFVYIPNCCQALLPRAMFTNYYGTGGGPVMGGGVYNYPPTAMQGGVMMTPQGTVIMQPGMMQPGMMQPGMMQPGMMQPGMMQPGMMQPGMMQPGMMQPGMMQPGMMQPGMMQPGMMQPGMMQPGMMQPGMMQPGMMAPQTTTVPPPEMAAKTNADGSVTVMGGAGGLAPTSAPATAPPSVSNQPTAYTYTAQAPLTESALNEMKPPPY